MIKYYQNYTFAILTLIVLAASCSSSSVKEVNKPNVVVIFTDDMNFEDIGALGGQVLTPTIDSLMKKGVEFTNFYDCSAVCSPSRYNMLTGRYASRSKSLSHQFPTDDPAFLRWNVDIDEGDRTIAHVMKENGYTTGMVGKYHNMQNGAYQKDLPEDADPFDPDVQKQIKTNYDTLCKVVQKTTGFDVVASAYVNNLHALGLPKSMRHHNMEWITEGAIDFIDQNKPNVSGKPFFLYYATTLPHAPAPIQSMYADPRITPSGMLEKAPEVQPSRMDVIERVKNAGLPEKVAPYTWLDDAIGALINKLENENLLENTVILFASDHGGNNAKMTCYEKGVRAPAFVYWKNHFRAGKKVDEITANIDFAPTIYDLCNITPNTDEIIDGKSLLPLIDGKNSAWRASLLLEITYSRAIVTDTWKYLAVRFPQKIQEEINKDKSNLYNQEGTLYSANNPDGLLKARYKADELYPAYFDRDQLFNLELDNHEQTNLVNDPKHAEKLKEMKQILKKQLVQFPHAFGEFTK